MRILILALFFTPLLATLPSAMNCPLPQEAEGTAKMFFSADFLLWECKEQGLDYAFKNVSTQATQELSVYETHPNWEPAFKLGAGVHFEHDRWDLAATYTFFQTHANDAAEHFFSTTALAGPGMLPVWICPTSFGGNGVGVRFSRAEADWKIRAQWVDLTLSRPFFVAEKLSVEPGFGFRGAWLHQRFNVSYTGGNQILAGLGNLGAVISSTINMANFSNNVGPQCSLLSRWRFGQRWDLFSHLSGALLASRFSVDRQESDFFTRAGGSAGTSQEYINLQRTYWTFTPQGELSLGLRFGDCVKKVRHTFYYGLSLSYDAVLFWKQNQLMRYIDNFSASTITTSVAPTQGDLFFHGVTLNLEFDF